jgi:3-dehydroquinate synthase class II
MKELWVEIALNASPYEKAKLLKLINESADVLLDVAEARSLSGEGTIQVLSSFDSDAIKRMKSEGEKVALRISIKGKEDEITAVRAAELSTDYIIVNCLDWRVIPLENLVARTHGKSKLIAEVLNAEDAKLVLENTGVRNRWRVAASIGR